jgi:VIT1/CCC1 family predicted Fe2+/Mn2+ transporter
LGEFVSVSSQRDSETAQLAIERSELRHLPDAELAELTAIYQRRGLSAQTATQVAKDLTAHDALTAHAHAELNIDPEDLANPWQAAAASAASFIIGALLPLVAILLPPNAWRVPVTFAAVLAALALTGGAQRPDRQCKSMARRAARCSRRSSRARVYLRRRASFRRRRQLTDLSG